MKKEKKEKKPKPKYNMLQNVSFMLKTAAEAKEKKVIVVIAVLVVIAVGSNLLGVYAAPLVIKGLQDNLPLEKLLLTVLCVYGSMAALSMIQSYINTGKTYPRVSVRTHILKQVNDKACTVSFQCRLEKKFRDLCRGAYDHCGGKGRTHFQYAAMAYGSRKSGGRSYDCVSP